MKKNVTLTNREMYLSPELPVYVNRVYESFRLEQHRHEFIELSYVSEGRGFHYIEGNVIPVVKGDLFYLPTGVSHVFRPATPTAGEDRLIVYNCLFDEAFALEMVSGVCRLDDRIVNILTASYPGGAWLHVRDRGEVYQHAFNTLLEEFQQRRTGFLGLLQAEILRIMVHMLRALEAPAEQPAAPNPGGDPAVIRIAERIRQRPAEALSAKRYAAEAGLSERHFRRLFKERFQMTFLEYVHKCRIEFCCERLSSSGEKVSVIARQAGYSDMKHFNRLFKKMTGLTPLAYRKTASVPI